MRAFKYSLCAILILIGATPSHAFNGMRRGFVLGGGLGVAPAVHYSKDVSGDGDASLEPPEETKRGPAGNLFLGYGWNEQNLIVFEFNLSSMESDELGSDARISQGYAGPAWYHYFKPIAPTFFSIAGVGFYSCQVDEGASDWGRGWREGYSHDRGFGWQGGAGYEISHHLQVSFVVNGGKTSHFNIDYSHLNVEFLIGAVAF